MKATNKILSKVDCEFSLLDDGRKYSGQHRKYVIENAREVCYSPATRELIKNREALGFYGHGRRVLSGKMLLPEFDVVQLPGGKSVELCNVPSNVTTKFEIDKDGTVRHSQDILDTDSGRIVDQLNRSKIGGFSWACPGEDGGSKGVTKLSGFAGFDFVLQPGFNKNRGYVLESAGGVTNTGAILEAVQDALGIGADKAALVAARWMFGTDARNNDSFELEIERGYTRQLTKRLEDLTEKFVGERERADRLAEKAKAADAVCRTVTEGMRHLPFFVTERAMDEFLSGDTERGRRIFEAARSVDWSQYPIPLNRQEKKAADSEEPEYGSAAYGFKTNF